MNEGNSPNKWECTETDDDEGLCEAYAEIHRLKTLQPRDCGEDTALLDFAERYLGTIARFELVEVYHRIHGNFLAKGDNIRTAIRAAMKISSDNNKPRKTKPKSR